MIDVKALRQELGITQQELARRVGVEVLAVTRWEAGIMQPKGQRLARLIDLSQQRRLVVPVAQAASPPTESDMMGREILRLGEAVRRMGLKDEGHGRRSDHTIRKAIKLGRLRAWKAPGYRATIAEWCFFADDFEAWRLEHYQSHRDPRRNGAIEPEKRY